MSDIYPSTTNVPETEDRRPRAQINRNQPYFTGPDMLAGVLMAAVIWGPLFAGIVPSMMGSIRQIATTRNDLFVFEIDGRIAKPDIEAMARRIEQAFREQKTIDLMIIFRDWGGIDMSAAFDDEALAAQGKASSHVRHYAVVGAPGWARAMINLFSPFTPVEEKTFDLEEEAAAWKWIGGEPLEPSRRQSA